MKPNYNNLKALIMFLVILFGLYAILSFTAMICMENNYMDNVGINSFMIYFILVGWWISIIGNPYMNTNNKTQEKLPCKCCDRCCN